jgi:hypothetical protein
VGILSAASVRLETTSQNNKGEFMESARHRTGFAVAAMIVLTVVALTSTGCGILWPTRGRHFEDTERSGFLGNYSQLAPREGFDAQEVYVNPKAVWPRYNAIYIESVSLWVIDDSKKLDPKDQQMLTDMLYKSMSDKLGEKFKLVKEPGPGVIQLRMALTEAKGARVALNTVTTVVPQLRTASLIVGLGTDTAALVGAASMEAEATDAITNDRLAAVVDSRAGTKGIMRMLSKWADVEAICDHWGERARDFFAAQGVQQKVPQKKG